MSNDTSLSGLAEATPDLSKSEDDTPHFAASNTPAPELEADSSQAANATDDSIIDDTTTTDTVTDSTATARKAKSLARGPSVVDKFVIRLPSGLRQQIRQLSEQNRRSMNAEIILVLENHIRQQFVEQMTLMQGEEGFSPGQRHTEAELNRMLDNLPAEKKEALLELLG